MEERLTALLEASATLTGALALEAVLAAIVQVARRLLPADAYAVWRYEAQSGKWQIASASGLSAEYCEAAVRTFQMTPAMLSVPLVAD
jgi:GAF domain-containing protein